MARHQDWIGGLARASTMQEAVAHLRTGDWITRERARLVMLAILVAWVAGLAILVVTATGAVDLRGRPLGTDFSNVYAAGTFVLEGQPHAPFDPEQQHARERAIFGEGTPFYGWHYPPFFLLVAAALAMLPYLVALGVWQGVTLVLYLGAIGAIGRAASLARASAFTASPLWLLAALAYPAVFVNLGHGHNGFLTAALLGFGLALLPRAPLAAGMILGLLAYKPQFGVLIPLALLAGGHWRAIAGASITVVALVAGVTLLFGVETWQAFLASSGFTRTVVLESGDTGWHKIQSIFAWVRMWGGAITIAYAAQIAAGVACALAVALVWRAGAAFELQAAALILGSMLATPYSLDYDFMALAPAIAFLVRHGAVRGFDPYEKSAIAALWLMPLVARSVGQIALMPLGVWVMAAVFVLTVRRATRHLDLGPSWWLSRARS